MGKRIDISTWLVLPTRTTVAGDSFLPSESRGGGAGHRQRKVWGAGEYAVVSSLRYTRWFRQTSECTGRTHTEGLAQGTATIRPTHAYPSTTPNGRHEVTVRESAPRKGFAG